LAFGANARRYPQRIADQIRQFVLVVVKFFDIGLVLAHQINRQCERAGGVYIVIEIQVAMNRARFQDLGLQGDADRDQPLFFHCPILCEQAF